MFPLAHLKNSIFNGYLSSSLLHEMRNNSSPYEGICRWSSEEEELVIQQSIAEQEKEIVILLTRTIDEKGENLPPYATTPVVFVDDISCASYVEIMYTLRSLFRHGTMMMKNRDRRTSHKEDTFEYWQNLEHTLFLWNLFSENLATLWDYIVKYYDSLYMRYFPVLDYSNEIKDRRNKAVHQYLTPFALQRSIDLALAEVKVIELHMTAWDPKIWDELGKYVEPTLA
jgi:hypothetical protein